VSFVLSGDAITNLVVGDNVLAVEVHNFSAQSPDITFGMSLGYLQNLTVLPQLSISAENGIVTLTWNQTGFVLQQADSLAGPWTDLPGPVHNSPYSVPASAAAQYYRLRK